MLIVGIIYSYLEVQLIANFVLLGVVHSLVAHLEKLRDEELAERREKRRKQQEEEEAKKRKLEEDGKKNESEGMSLSVDDKKSQLITFICV
jgi:heme exporter protein D